MIALPWVGDWPITQRFGVNPKVYAHLDLAGHNGLDIGVPVGTELRAVCHGGVVEVGSDPTGYGYHVKVRSDAGEDWLYAHLSLSALPWVGARVVPGQTLCYSGRSGWSTGPHLHLGYRPVHGVRGWPFNGYADPLPILSA